MSLRIAINGFGRMGRLALRHGFGRSDFDYVHVNDPNGTPEGGAHLLNVDSVHGRWQRQAEATDDGLLIDGESIGWSTQETLPAARLAELGVDLVLECSGRFRTPEQLAPYLDAGIPKVVVSAPLKGQPADHAIDLVMGVNDQLYQPDQHHIITPASCTTNALAPIVKVVRAGLGLHRGVVTTLHCVTNTQTVIDHLHPDLRRARSASLSLIPTTTGSAKAIIRIFPELEGNLSSIAVRVPLQNTSMVDAVFEVGRRTTPEEVNQLFRDAADNGMGSILGLEDRPFVSIDYVGDARSSIVDGPSTMVIGGTQVKILAWYDNEWGYVARMNELVAKIGSSLPGAATNTAVDG